MSVYVTMFLFVIVGNLLTPIVADIGIDFLTAERTIELLFAIVLLIITIYTGCFKLF